MTVVDFPDYTEPQANANAISITGTPLLHGASKLATLTFALAAGAKQNQYIQFAKPGYLANIRPFYTGANGVTPFARVNWRWVDANPATLDFGQQDWIVPVHANGIYAPALAAGPSRGQWAFIEATNLDAGQPVTFAADIWETTQHLARDDWRDSTILAFTAPPGFTAAPGANPARNSLALTTVTLAASTDYILPLYAGQAFLDATIIPLAGASGTVQIYNRDKSALLYNSGTVTAQALFASIPVTLPREPCVLSLSTAGGSTTFEVALTVMEYAS